MWSSRNPGKNQTGGASPWGFVATDMETEEFFAEAWIPLKVLSSQRETCLSPERKPRAERQRLWRFSNVTKTIDGNTKAGLRFSLFPREGQRGWKISF